MQNSQNEEFSGWIKTVVDVPLTNEIAQANLG